METLSRVHAENLVRWARERPEVIVLSADLTGSVEADLFRAAYPERFFSMGIAEQNMLSVAGGMAREGFVPFVHTFAVFLYRRAYDQIAMSVAYPFLPVKMFGFLPGVLTPGGATHQAIEDLAVMRSLPNMTVLECGDATEVQSVLDVAFAAPGPVYVRMLRGELPRLFPPDEPMVLNKPRLLSAGTDLMIVTSGICTEEALRCAGALRRRGVSFCHLHVSTLKPFDAPEIAESIASTRFGVITLENHSILGGLGTAVAERIAEAGLGKKLVRLGIPDTFLHGASRSHLMKEYRLDAAALVAAVEAMIGDRLSIGEDELTNAAITVQSCAAAKAEDL